MDEGRLPKMYMNQGRREAERKTMLELARRQRWKTMTGGHQ